MTGTNEQKSKRPWGGPTVFVLLGMVSILVGGCSVESRYRTLSFLFDGVEHPDSVRVRKARELAAQARADSIAARRSSFAENEERRAPEVYIHAPYEEGDCTYCHQTEPGTRRFVGAVELNEPVQTLCVGCHDDKSAEALAEEFVWLHGPAAAGQCTGCHSPHQSMYPHLLKAAPGSDLCLKCHDRARLASTPSHVGTTESSCLDCHGPHGSSTRGRRPEGDRVPASSAAG